MADKKGGAGKILGCVGCLALLLIGGIALAVTGLVSGGALWAYSRSDVPIQFDVPAPVDVIEPVEVPEPDTQAEPDTEAERDTETDTEPDTEAPAVTTPAPAPAPSPRPTTTTTPNPSSIPTPSPIATPTPRPPPSPAPAPTASTSYVSVDGEGSVTLVGGGNRYRIPGNVPAGRYDIEVVFPGQEAVVVDKITVREGSGATIRCNARMGVCRSR